MQTAARKFDKMSHDRTIGYISLIAVLVTLSLAFQDVHWRGNQQLHSLLELTSTLTALFVAVMAWSMYRADTKQTNLLILFLGFLGTAILDGYHCLATTSYFANLFPSGLDSLVPWSWHASRTYLSIFVCLAFWVTGKRKFRRNQVARIATVSAAILTLFCFLFFAFFPLPPAYFATFVGGRPQEYVPAMFFLAALIGHLYSNRWRTQRLEHWYILSLIVHVATQAMIMPHSQALFDCMFDLAHVLKIVSYSFVGIGLTRSMADLFRSAEDAKLMAFAVEHTQQGVAILDRESAVAFVNDGFAQMTGYSRKRAVGKPLQELLACPQQNELEWQQIAQCFRDGKGCELEMNCRTQSNDSFRGIAELRPMVEATGQYMQFVLFLRDVSAQRASEKEKEALTEELLTVSRRVGMSEIATGTLHNVGNVLNSVNISTSLLLNRIRSSKLDSLTRVSELVAEQEDFARFIQQDCRGQNLQPLLSELSKQLANENESNEAELKTLVQNVEHIKQIVAMQQSFARVGGVTESVDVVDLLKSAYKIYESGIARSNIRVQWEIESNIPKVHTDRHKVLQILVNFISNAKQAMQSQAYGSGVLTFTIRVTDNELCIDVRDNGHGITSENMSKIFSHGFTTKRDGHGFGLHSSALTAQELGGSVSMQSDGEGLGATFTLRLPLVHQELPVS